jgi:hypothetical protein
MSYLAKFLSTQFEQGPYLLTLPRNRFHSGNRFLGSLKGLQRRAQGTVLKPAVPSDPIEKLAQRASSP